MDIIEEIKDGTDYTQSSHEDTCKDMSKKKSIFNKGDRVFHPYTGWAEVTDVGGWPPFFMYKITGEKGNGTFNQDDISFTEYEVEMHKKGFSHERPDKAETLFKKIEDRLYSVNKITYKREDFLCLVNDKDFELIDSYLKKKYGFAHGIFFRRHDSTLEYIKCNFATYGIEFARCSIIIEGNFQLFTSGFRLLGGF